MTTRSGESPEKYTGDVVIVSGEVTVRMKTNKEKVLAEIKRTIGNSEVTLPRLEAAPSWIIQQSLKVEHEDNWREAYKEVI